ncbi:MAG TPA: transcriptional regulator NrdR [Fusobacteria bacterium]|nr:transcriptional regulator NrdR [Fusobacteriota bacterium]|tara:strand:- start:560 stop:1015 length:456 start_codon:yes stop_codon:yes gene_type:complete
MKCPFCNKLDTKVINTRFSSNGLSVRRRRSCDFCHKRFTTYETVEDFSITVMKRDGTKELFDEAKMMHGLMLATEKRNVSHDILENIVSQIQRQVEESGKREITSRELGTLVMKELKRIDAVGYLRFASVFRDFKNIDSFIKEIDKMNKEN